MHEQFRKFARRSREELSDEELCSLTGDFEKLRTRLAAAGHGPSAQGGHERSTTSAP